MTTADAYRNPSDPWDRSQRKVLNWYYYHNLNYPSVLVGKLLSQVMLPAGVLAALLLFGGALVDGEPPTSTGSRLTGVFYASLVVYAMAQFGYLSRHGHFASPTRVVRSLAVVLLVGFVIGLITEDVVQYNFAVLITAGGYLLYGWISSMWKSVRS